ncbi:putative phage protein (DUF935 domain) [Campylobacter blaseri]|uniref:DUF935 family protein n=1 Tax=Campylobacter blaseri TaxID=2042961 RepID=A0A2P8QYM7_9BACT|nr:DUF935 family protein [Campylobacter blaseri]PSM51347.1 hypothetical protein CQ405_08130 [Campylobacter blaseri]PSM52797.1 hypothetical protein CRN67_08135 [Campylobacter blaseri]QKF86097.1 putative phage protein (DUF935 domain) [Campylobacter blaseri]
MAFLKNLFLNKKDKNKALRLSPNDTLINALFSTSISAYKISDSDLNLITRDLSFTQADISRKAVTEKKELAIICDDETIKENLLSCFYSDIISQILETYLYGINVFEVNYKPIDGLFYPILRQRDFRNFEFKDDVLHFNLNGFLQEIPKFKVIYGLSRANFYKPYGDALLEKLYFPVKLKNASLKFWIEFIEKFGSPWAIAKSSFDAETLAKEVFAMLSGDVAVIDQDESIELTQPNKDSSHDKLINYCDNQISKVILGANLTSSVKEGSFAAANIHNQIREDIALSDANILIYVVNRAIKFFKEVNGLNIDIEAKLFDKNKPNIELSERDLKLYNMGFIPTKEYIEETYNYEIDEQKSKIIENKGHLNSNYLAFKESLKPKYLDMVDKAMDDEFLNKELINASSSLDKKLDEILNKSATYEEAFKEFMSLYQDNYTLNELEDSMFKAIANSQMHGLSDDI